MKIRLIILALLSFFFAGCGNQAIPATTTTTTTVTTSVPATAPVIVPTTALVLQPTLQGQYLYASDNAIIYLDFTGSIAIDLEKSTDYINSNACWNLLWEDDLGYSQDGSTVTITALYINRFTPFFLQSDSSLMRDEVDQDTGQVIHEHFLVSDRATYNAQAAQFETRLPKCS